MSNGNPFTGKLPAGFPGDKSPDELPFDQVLAYLAEPLWDQLDTLPRKAEATLAKRKLQELVFWGERAAEPLPAPVNGA